MTYLHSISIDDTRCLAVGRGPGIGSSRPRVALRQGFDETLDGGLILPRSLCCMVASLAEQGGSRLEVTDDRAMGTAQEFTLAGALTPEQKEAATELARHDLDGPGGSCAPTPEVRGAMTAVQTEAAMDGVPWEGGGWLGPVIRRALESAVRGFKHTCDHGRTSGQPSGQPLQTDRQALTDTSGH
jgi:hypothetical protein